MPRASQVAWILVVRPPRERPIHSLVRLLFLRQHFKDPLPDTTRAPAHVASMNHPKVAKAFGQIAPGNACAITIEHCLDKEAIIPGSHSDGSHSAGEQVLNPLPLIITESVASGSHWTSLPLGKEKGVFPPRRTMSPKRSSVYLMTGPS